MVSLLFDYWVCIVANSIAGYRYHGRQTAQRAGTERQQLLFSSVETSVRGRKKGTSTSPPSLWQEPRKWWEVQRYAGGMEGHLWLGGQPSVQAIEQRALNVLKRQWTWHKLVKTSLFLEMLEVLKDNDFWRYFENAQGATSAPAVNQSNQDISNSKSPCIANSMHLHLVLSLASAGRAYSENTLLLSSSSSSSSVWNS